MSLLVSVTNILRRIEADEGQLSVQRTLQCYHRNDSDEKVAIDCFGSLWVLRGEGRLAMDGAMDGELTGQ